MINNHEIDIWQAELTASEPEIKQYLCTLSEDERKRAEKFHFDKDRNRFIIRRAILRKLISNYLVLDPAEIVFEYNNYGKPYLFGEHAKKLQFNLSFSNELSLFAFSSDRAIGIDVEIINPGIMEDAIADRYFSSSEINALYELPHDQQLIGFYNCWTRKEAWIKAVGKGLSIPLDSFEVSLKPGEPARLISSKLSSPNDGHWSMHELVPAPKYIAAVAVEGISKPPNLFNWR